VLLSDTSVLEAAKELVISAGSLLCWINEYANTKDSAFPWTWERTVQFYYESRSSNYKIENLN
jgi:hypothetical protein